MQIKANEPFPTLPEAYITMNRMVRGTDTIPVNNPGFLASFNTLTDAREEFEHREQYIAKHFSRAGIHGGPWRDGRGSRKKRDDS